MRHSLFSAAEVDLSSEKLGTKWRNNFSKGETFWKHDQHSRSNVAVRVLGGELGFDDGPPHGYEKQRNAFEAVDFREHQARCRWKACVDGW